MPVACQVNVDNMTPTAIERSGQTAQKMLGVDILQPLLQRRRPQRVLVLGHARAEEVPLESPAMVQIIRLGVKASPELTLRCRLEALPLATAVFDLVVMQHLVGDGTEAVFTEALRVLAPGGELVISGLNAHGLRYRLGNRNEQFPGLKQYRIIQQLKSESFTIVHCLRAGLLGLSWPQPMDNWHGLVLPCADHIVLHALHRPGAASGNVLRFKRAQASATASAAFETFKPHISPVGNRPHNIHMDQLN